jgi:hypothetical protein
MAELEHLHTQQHFGSKQHQDGPAESSILQFGQQDDSKMQSK